MVQRMMKSAGVAEGEGVTFEKFRQIVRHVGDTFHSQVCLEMRSKKPVITRAFSYDTFDLSRSRLDSDTGDGDGDASSATVTLIEWYCSVINNIRSKIQYVFWLVLYTLVMFLIFAERAYYFS